MSIKRRILALVACLAVALLLVPAVAGAEEPSRGTYLALGDSITSGYGLDAEAGERSFAELVAASEGLALDDSYASDQGLTSSDLRALLTDEAFQKSVADASLVSVTIGGNDVMNALYDYLANAWSAANPDDVMSAEDVRNLLENGTIAGKSALLELGARVLPDFFTSSEAQSALAALSDNLAEVVFAIKGLNPNAPLVIVNQYNPYAHLGAAASLPQVEAIVSAFESGVQTLNALVADGAVTGGYVVADAYSALDSAGENPCNASVSLVEVNLDFHPNAYGHELIAGAVLETLDPASSFDDVSTEDWYCDAVGFVSTRGLMTGYEGTALFGPNDALGREQAAAVLYRALGAGAEAPACGMADVAQGEWYAASVNWAVASGAITGYGSGSGLFGVGDALTRDQFATIIARVAKVDLSNADPSALDAFSDGGEVAEWAVPAMSWAVESGVIQGSDDGNGGKELRSGAQISRGEMAAMIMRAVDSGLLPIG